MAELERSPTVALLVVLLSFMSTSTIADKSIYTIDASQGLGRRFDGIGAISGGGATSKLLLNYPDKQRNEVLDFLFKPNFGASLHILKVEIGGNAQSSEGTESSHMHEPWDENYQRGYEWWLMKEAKKRNPGIKLYGLPWGFPGWVGGGHWWPFEDDARTADYIIKWILGAKKYHNLTIDYIGLWNEKPYSVSYVKTLKKSLVANGLKHVQIVAADLIGGNSWDVARDIYKDQVFNASVDILGGHYTGTSTTDEAKNCGKPLWSSEDYSANNDETGGGCMARLLNQNYVNGYMTNLIAWNLLVAYYPDLPYDGHGLMNARHPWSGYYEVKSPIWTTAHTSQFTDIGWNYLKHGHGVGFLNQGGSYVSLMSPGHDFTMVIETMNTEMADFCKRPPVGPQKVVKQNVTFAFVNGMDQFESLYLWYTKLGLGNEKSVYFQNMGSVKVLNGKLDLSLEVNAVYTLTTVDTGKHGSFDAPPPAKPFPVPYKDNMEEYEIFQEPFNFAQQVGVFETAQSANKTYNKVMRQVMINPPIHWCPFPQKMPINLIGNSSLSDISLSVDVSFPKVNSSTGAFIGARIDQSGCFSFVSHGVFFFFNIESQTVEITLDIVRTQTIKSIKFPIEHERWYNLNLKLKGNGTVAMIDGQTVFSSTIASPFQDKGFVGLGTSTFGLADFDNFSME